MPQISIALLEALFAHAPAGLGFWDTDLRYQRVNDSLAEINGLPAEAHIGQRPGEILGEVGRRAERTMRAVLETGEPLLDAEFSRVLPGSRGAGHYRASFYPVPGPDGEAVGLGAIVVDVTAQVEATQREQAARADAERARARAEVLLRGVAAVSGSMQPRRILDALAHAAVPALSDWCVIHLASRSGTPELAAVAHHDPAQEPLAWELNERYPPEGDAGAGAVIRSGQTEVYWELPEELIRAGAQDEAHAETMLALGMRSLAILPLTARGRTLGALTLVTTDVRRPLTAERVETGRYLATQAALALDNAGLYAEQLTVARSLQQSLLPGDLPVVEGLEVAARYRAAGRSNEVGGDFYDLFDRPDGPVFVIGDVAGKGPDAAAVTSLVRWTLHAATLRGGDLEDALRLVNDVLLERPGAHPFCSAICGRISMGEDGSARVTQFSAGHPSALVLRAGGEVEAVPEGGQLLGILPDPAFGTTEVVLGRGDLLLLYTDGATELRGMPLGEGDRVLRDTLADARGRGARDVVERIEHRVLVLSGGEPRDDLALVALRVPPLEPVLD